MYNKIREIREERLMTQEDLAEKSGISRTTISDLENQKVMNITTATMKKIAIDGLNSTIPEIFFNE